MVFLLGFTVLGLILGVFIPLIIGLINHLQFKFKNRKEPKKVDTASGAVSFLLIFTVPFFGFVGLMIDLFYLFFS